MQICGMIDAFDMAEKDADLARQRFGQYSSPHELYAVLQEEIEEMWDAIKIDNFAHARVEAIQVAAVALRFASETTRHEDAGTYQEGVN